MATTPVTVIYPAPIPVGHRVHVRWYRIVTENVWGKRKASPVADWEPVILDLDTGIEYCSDLYLGSGGGKAPREPLDVGGGPAEGAEVARELRGTVAACRVVSVRGFSEFDVQTHLVIRAD